MKLIPKNWSTFQHYKHRSPPWIRLHRSLLDDFEFHRLPIASKALAPCLWLLASEAKDGLLDTSVDEIAFRLRMTPVDVSKALEPLIKAGFFAADSNALAERKQNRTTETETETETEKRQRQKRASALPDDFVPTTDHHMLAAKLAVNMDVEMAKFADYHRAKGSTMKDWNAALNTWIRNAAEFNKRSTPVQRMSQQQRLEANNRRAVEEFLNEEGGQ